MSTTIPTVQDPDMVCTIANPEEEITKALASQIEVEFIKCECCNLIEECTRGYIETIRELYQGKWLCGLCGEAIKDEITRHCTQDQSLLSIEEALDRHMKFRNEFTSSSESSPRPSMHLISTIRQMLRRSIDSPSGLRSTPPSPTNNYRVLRARTLTRSDGCLPTYLVD